MKTAFVFPGQGSQSVNMLADIADAFPLLNERLSEASDLLHYDLAKIVFEGPADSLNQTIHTQPALFVTDVAMYDIWQQQGGVAPSVMAGHSLGEYAALSAAGALDFADGVQLVSQRAQFMQAAVPEGEGAMAAIILLSIEKIEEICQQAAEGEVVSIANINEVNQIVIAGQSAAVERVMVLAKAAGAKLAKRLPVSVPSHCFLMKPAAEQLTEILSTIILKTPVIPVINNVDVATPSDATAIADALIRQVYMPVRWLETVEKIASEGVANIVECGPGKVLSGLNRRICKQVPALSLNSVEHLNSLLAES